MITENPHSTSELIQKKEHRKRPAWDVAIRLTISSALLGACNVRNFVNPTETKEPKKTTVLTTTITPPESTQTQIHPKKTETQLPTYDTHFLTVTAEAQTTSRAAASKTTAANIFAPTPTYDKTLVAPDLTTTPTVDISQTEVASTIDLEAVLDLVEKELHPYAATTGGVVFLEVKAQVSLAELDIKGKSTIPERLGGGKVLWDFKIPVGNTFIYAVMGRQLPDGSFVAMSQSGLFSADEANRFTDLITKVYTPIDKKTCIVPMDLGAGGSADDWELAIKPQQNWRDTFFLSDDGTKVYVLPDLLQC